MSDALHELRQGFRAIAAYEAKQKRSTRAKRDKVRVYIGHVQRWNRSAEAVGSTEACPLLELVRGWCAELGITAPGMPRDTGNAPPADEPKPPPEPTNDDGSKEAAASQGLRESVLPPGNWLKSHADVVEREVAAVKSRAADPDDYAAAKREFLERNLPLLRKYIKKPPKSHSPLFAYCVLYLADTGDLDGALELAAEAVRLGVKSAVKRDFHQIQADLQKEQFERDCQALAADPERGGYEQLRKTRDALMNNPHRSNHWKAEVCKSFGHLAYIVGDLETAKRNLNEVRFLDPKVGVETLLGKVEAALNG